MNTTVTKPSHEDASPLPTCGKAAASATSGMNIVSGAMRLSGFLVCVPFGVPLLVECIVLRRGEPFSTMGISTLHLMRGLPDRRLVRTIAQTKGAKFVLQLQAGYPLGRSPRKNCKNELDDQT